MYLGDYQLGDRLPLSVMCVAANGTPVLPDAAPWATVILLTEATPRRVAELPPVDLFGSPGLFGQAIHLDARLTEGYFSVCYSWLVSGASRMKVDTFRIVPGGNSAGAVIAIYPYHRPHAEFLVQQTDGAKLLKGRNPKV